MDEAMGTGDMVIAAVASLGVVVLLIVFVYVLKIVILRKDDEPDQEG